MIKLPCPCCGSALQLADHCADAVIRCPECEERLRVPAAQSPPVGVYAASGTAMPSAGKWVTGLVALLAAVPVIGAMTLFGPGRGGNAAGPAVVPVVAAEVAVPLAFGTQSPAETEEAASYAPADDVAGVSP